MLNMQHLERSFLMKKTSTTPKTNPTPETRSTAEKIETIVLVAAGIFLVLMTMGKTPWIVGLISVVYILVWSFATFGKNTTVTQLFKAKKKKIKKAKPEPADTVDPLDPGKKPAADKLSDAKANTWTKVVAFRDAKEFAVWQEKAKLDPAKAPKGKVYDADTNCYIDEPKAAPAPGTTEDKDIAKILMAKGCPVDELPEAVRKVKALKPLGFSDEEAADEVMKPRT